MLFFVKTFWQMTQKCMFYTLFIFNTSILVFVIYWNGIVLRVQHISLHFLFCFQIEGERNKSFKTMWWNSCLIWLQIYEIISRVNVSKYFSILSLSTFEIWKKKNQNQNQKLFFICLKWSINARFLIGILILLCKLHIYSKSTDSLNLIWKVVYTKLKIFSPSVCDLWIELEGMKVILHIHPWRISYVIQKVFFFLLKCFARYFIL